MAFTYDTTTDRGRVRLLITDVDSTNPCFDDAEIDAFLSLDLDDVWAAAATGLRAIAANEVLVQKRIKLMDLSTDGPSEAKALGELADKYDAKSSANAETFDIAEMVVDQFSFTEKINNEALRDL